MPRRERWEIGGKGKERNPNLVGGDRPPGVVAHDGGDDGGDAGAGVAAPGEVEAGDLREELVLAGGDRGGHDRLGVVHVLVGGGGGEARSHGAVDAEDEEDEEERGEQLQERRSLVPPCEDRVLPEQRQVLLRHEPSPRLELH